MAFKSIFGAKEFQGKKRFAFGEDGLRQVNGR